MIVAQQEKAAAKDEADELGGEEDLKHLFLLNRSAERSTAPIALSSIVQRLRLDVGPAGSAPLCLVLGPAAESKSARPASCRGRISKYGISVYRIASKKSTDFCIYSQNSTEDF